MIVLSSEPIDPAGLLANFIAEAAGAGAIASFTGLVRDLHDGQRVEALWLDHHERITSQAIEGIGAKKDGVIRHHQARPDGTVRDTHIYSILASEWRDVKRHLELRLARH